MLRFAVVVNASISFLCHLFFCWFPLFYHFDSTFFSSLFLTVLFQIDILLIFIGHSGKQTNMISAMIKYGSDKNRFKSMTKEDMAVASDALDPALMQLFQYEMPSLE